jgi:alpha-tubulin suppressor-like RCC1 family protein
VGDSPWITHRQLALLVLCSATACGGGLETSNPSGDGGLAATVTVEAATADAVTTDAPIAEAATTNVTPSDAGSPTGTVVAIAVGWWTSCALLSTGEVECRGEATDGELGNGLLADSDRPVLVSGVQTATRITGGGYERCAFLQAGDVTCWGDNSYGEIESQKLGLMVSTPLILPGLKGARAVFAGFQEMCAVLADGGVSCGGGTDDVNGGTWSVTTPAGVVDISVDEFYGCALLEDGTVACWGIDGEGELGNGTEDFSNTTTATLVPGLTGVTAIATGGQFTCARLSTGTVSCWGRNTEGQLGSSPQSLCPMSHSCSPVPIPVPGLTGVTAIAAGEVFACALLADGTVECWGDNENGELGNASVPAVFGSASFSPVPVSGLTDIVSIAAGGYHACALTGNGSVFCWGQDDHGEVGAAPTQQCETPCVTAPVLVQQP